MTSVDVLSNRTLANFITTSQELKAQDSDSVKYRDTPARALPIGELVGEEDFLDEARGVNEIHIEVSSNDFSRFEEDPDYRIADEYSNGISRVRENEITVGVIEYTGSTLFSTAAVENFVNSLPEQFDILSTPLMSEQIDSADLDENPENYNQFIENSETYLAAVDNIDADCTIIGTLPVVPWELIENDGEGDGLIDILLLAEVSGFCVDFLDKKPTAQNRVKRWITPFTELLGEEGRHRDSLLYAINAYRGSNRTGSPGSPAEDFYVFGLGFDILGGQYYTAGGGWPPDDVVRFRCFDSETFEQEYIDVRELADELPDNSGFDHDHILGLVDDRGQRQRLEELLEAEQMALGYNDLRRAIDANLGSDYIRDKLEDDQRIEPLFESVKRAYDEVSPSA